MQTELRKVLTAWLKLNRPVVCLEKDYFVVCRSTGLLIVTGNQMRIGDIRLVTVIGSELVKGLTPDHWTTLLAKVMCLRNVVFVKAIEDIFAQEGP